MYVFKLEYIFYNMVTARVAHRLTVEKALDLYEQFIEDSGLLDKYDKMIVDHIVVDRTGSPPKSPEKPVVFDRKFRPNPEFVNADPNPCPEGKERNPKTARCVAICKDGYARNPEFKCVRNKTVKVSSKTPKNAKKGKK